MAKGLKLNREQYKTQNPNYSHSIISLEHTQLR